MTDIVERLREGVEYMDEDDGGGPYISVAEELMYGAADEIVRLRAEVGELQQTTAEWREAYEDVAAERDRLRDALDKAVREVGAWARKEGEQVARAEHAESCLSTTIAERDRLRDAAAALETGKLRSA